MGFLAKWKQDTQTDESLFMTMNDLGFLDSARNDIISHQYMVIAGQDNEGSSVFSYH